jgi:hypothetical protein
MGRAATKKRPQWLWAMKIGFHYRYVVKAFRRRCFTSCSRLRSLTAITKPGISRAAAELLPIPLLIR